MTQLAGTTHAELSALLHDWQTRLADSVTVQEAAQRAAFSVYKKFGESLALVRVYATCAFGRLPPVEKAFATTLAESAGVRDQVGDKTFVLCLLGTFGAKNEWTDRLKSAGHLAIPLCGATFVESIPMVSRLMHDMGLGTAWLDRYDSEMVVKTLGNMAGLFYVPDATSSQDARGRHIVPAREFVAAEGIKTVFGLGGSYLNGTFVTMLLFTRESLTREQAELFLPIINAFKAASMELAMQKRLLQ